MAPNPKTIPNLKASSTDPTDGLLTISTTNVWHGNYGVSLRPVGDEPKSDESGYCRRRQDHAEPQWQHRVRSQWVSGTFRAAIGTALFDALATDIFTQAEEAPPCRR